MSQQERITWVALGVSAWIWAWYFIRVLSLPADAPLLGPAMIGFVFRLLFLAILAGIAAELLLRWVQKRTGGDPGRREQLDERDRLINLRAGRNAHIVLTGALALILGHIVSTQWLSAVVPGPDPTHPGTVLRRLATGPLSVPLLAQLLLLAMTLAGLCRYVTRIVCYRRGY